MTETPDPTRPPAPDPNPGPSPLTLLVAAVLVVVGGYFLSMKLREMGRIQDCAMSGRTNCAPIDRGSD